MKICCLSVHAGGTLARVRGSCAIDAGRVPRLALDGCVFAQAFARGSSVYLGSQAMKVRSARLGLDRQLQEEN